MPAVAGTSSEIAAAGPMMRSSERTNPLKKMVTNNTSIEN